MYFTVAVLTNHITSEHSSTYGNLTLIGSAPAVAGRTNNDRHFLELLFDIGLVPRVTTDQDGKQEELQITKKAPIPPVAREGQ